MLRGRENLRAKISSKLIKKTNDDPGFLYVFLILLRCLDCIFTLSHVLFASFLVFLLFLSF